MPTDKKTIKSYDSYAVKWARKIRSGNNIAHTFLEKPAMYKELTALKGKIVLCVGCGTGEECMHLKSKGAKKVVGIDVSKGLIALAKKNFPTLEFYVMDMENMQFPPRSFDFVYSSLVMHYVKDWKKTLRQIYKVLKDGGVFLFSTHHPVKWGAERERMKNRESFLMGYAQRKTGTWKVFGDYMSTRKINDTWFKEFNVNYYHRPFSEIISDIVGSGFLIEKLIEPRPLKAVKKVDPTFYRVRNKIPLFMIFRLRKP